MKQKNIRIGFTFNIIRGRPSNFLESLKKSFQSQNLDKTSYFIDPFVECNIFPNKVRNIFNKLFFRDERHEVKLRVAENPEATKFEEYRLFFEDIHCKGTSFLFYGP